MEWTTDWPEFGGLYWIDGMDSSLLHTKALGITVAKIEVITRSKDANRIRKILRLSVHGREAPIEIESHVDDLYFYGPLTAPPDND